jgi:gamma-glutamyltranspeptidase / glutathione hydrolase
VKQKGVVAAGHEATAGAAELILKEGGNAFDAVVAAHLAACVAEPVLSSLGGGGFLLAHTVDGVDRLYDFFVQTPKRRCPAEEADFYPISADFGTARQEFHIGSGAIATPGTVKGLFTVHKELCTMPMTCLAEPAVALARDGVRMNAFQAYIFDIVQAIYAASPDRCEVYRSRKDRTRLLGEGERLLQPELADSLDALAREGEGLFYQGEIAMQISRLCAEQGGHLSEMDLACYRVVKREPLTVGYREKARLLTNPAPSSGGILIAFALKLVESLDLKRYRCGTATYLDLLVRVLDETNRARIDAHLDGSGRCAADRLLDARCLADYRAQIKGRPLCSRGTTHMSIIDQQGNIASLTASNGEGCGRFIAGTGIMLNNMLGEEDLNPGGFHRWPEDLRMTSMMAPSIVFGTDGRSIALGSGGSNRIRSALLEVLLNLIDFGMDLETAVRYPRVHHEAGHLSIEGGLADEEVQLLVSRYSNHKLWPTLNLFFGGVHSVAQAAGGFSGVGDPRRGGVSVIV